MRETTIRLDDELRARIDAARGDDVSLAIWLRDAAVMRLASEGRLAELEQRLAVLERSLRS